MAGKKSREVSMRKIREILRLGLQCQLGKREIARSCNVSHPTVSGYMEKAQKAGLRYEDIEKMDDFNLHSLLKKEPEISAGTLQRPQPDWAYIHQELKKKSVTLQLLWQEYKEIHPGGYQSSQFYERYHNWKKKLDISLRQHHKAGEKMFVDYAGQTVPIRDPQNGTIRQAQIFVAVLGASNYTYAQASEDQSLSSWINCHIRAFEFFKGVAKATVCDNLRSGVSNPCRYEPDLNPTYHDLSRHYGTVVIPARAGRPKDKAKVETGVLVVERWILAALRKMTFFSLAQLNQAIAELLVKLNTRPFKKLPGSRMSCFIELEQPALLPLPALRYEFAQWKKARVNIDYHVELKGHYYSVPYQLVQEKVEIRYTAATVEIMHGGKRVASHLRDDQNQGRHTTIREHMPKTHQQYLEWTPSRLISWAEKIGSSTGKTVKLILKSRDYPEQGYRSCLGILRLAKAFSNNRLEAACCRALLINGCSYKSILSILKKGLDKNPLPVKERQQEMLIHENIRGGQYFIKDN